MLDVPQPLRILDTIDGSMLDEAPEGGLICFIEGLQFGLACLTDGQRRLYIAVERAGQLAYITAKAVALRVQRIG